MTKAYGASDDLLEFEGDVRGEVGCFGAGDREHGILAICSDGTLFEAKYGKGDAGIWGIQLLQQGSLFDRIEPCADEDATIHSDQIFFKDGLKFAFAATEWERVK